MSGIQGMEGLAGLTGPFTMATQPRRTKGRIMEQLPGRLLRDGRQKLTWQLLSALAALSASSVTAKC